MPGTSGDGVFSSGNAVTTSGRPWPEPPLEDWQELLDAVRRRINRRLLRPEEEDASRRRSGNGSLKRNLGEEPRRGLSVWRAFPAPGQG